MWGTTIIISRIITVLVEATYEPNYIATTLYGGILYTFSKPP